MRILHAVSSARSEPLRGSSADLVSSREARRLSDDRERGPSAEGRPSHHDARHFCHIANATAIRAAQLLRPNAIGSVGAATIRVKTRVTRSHPGLGGCAFAQRARIVAGDSRVARDASRARSTPLALANGSTSFPREQKSPSGGP